jgi:hypothetical protein
MTPDELPVESSADLSLGANVTRMHNESNRSTLPECDSIHFAIVPQDATSLKPVNEEHERASTTASVLVNAKESFDKGNLDECLKSIFSVSIAFRPPEMIRLMNRAIQKKEKTQALQSVVNALEAEARGNLDLATEHLQKIPAHLFDLKIISADTSITPSQILLRVDALRLEQKQPTTEGNQTVPPTSETLSAKVATESTHLRKSHLESTQAISPSPVELNPTSTETSRFETTIERFFVGVSNWFHELSIAKSFAIPLLALCSVFILLVSFFSIVYSFNYIHQASSLQAGLKFAPPSNLRTAQNTNIEMMNYLENRYSQYSVLTHYVCIAANILTIIGALFLLLRKRWAICIITSILVTFTATWGWAPGILSLVLLLRKDVRESFPKTA